MQQTWHLEQYEDLIKIPDYIYFMQNMDGRAFYIDVRFIKDPATHFMVKKSTTEALDRNALWKKVRVYILKKKK